VSERRPPIGRWHSVEDISDLFDCSENHVRRLIHIGALEAQNIAVLPGDVKWRICDRALTEFADRRSSLPGSPLRPMVARQSA
jgi:hypothetical protein